MNEDNIIPPQGGSGTAPPKRMKWRNCCQQWVPSGTEPVDPAAWLRERAAAVLNPVAKAVLTEAAADLEAAIKGNN